MGEYCLNHLPPGDLTDKFTSSVNALPWGLHRVNVALRSAKGFFCPEYLSSGGFWKAPIWQYCSESQVPWYLPNVWLEKVTLCFQRPFY